VDVSYGYQYQSYITSIAKLSIKWVPSSPIPKQEETIGIQLIPTTRNRNVMNKQLPCPNIRVWYPCETLGRSLASSTHRRFLPGLVLLNSRHQIVDNPTFALFNNRIRYKKCSSGIHKSKH